MANESYNSLYKQSSWNKDFVSNEIDPYFLKLPLCNIKFDFDLEFGHPQEKITSLEIAKSQQEYFGIPWSDRFNRFYPTEKQNKIIECLGLDRTVSYLHLQKPGQNHILHMDSLNADGKFDDLQDKPNQVVRVFIFLQDWAPGQIIQFGNIVHTKWKKGDVCYFRWHDIPHGTCNFGHQDRALLLVTGIRTSIFDSIINSNTPVQLTA